MKVSYDLHIHSTLSPCADNLQTPNNIMNMCMLKKLDIVSVTDHNSLKHLSTFHSLKDSYNFLFLYGVEVTLIEGIHVLVYLELLKDAQKLDSILESRLEKKSYNSDLLGKQILCDIDDVEVETYPNYLNSPLKMSYNELSDIARQLNGIVVLAHVDRNVEAILDVLNNRKNPRPDAIEVSKYANVTQFLDTYPQLRDYSIVTNSDAHTLIDISEPVNFLEIEKLTFQSLKMILGEKHE
jgi:PHP family Zn ribbon phosphoesterase